MNDEKIKALEEKIDKLQKASEESRAIFPFPQIHYVPYPVYVSPPFCHPCIQNFPQNGGIMVNVRYRIIL